MKKLVVLISGKQGSGKTTLANELMRRARGLEGSFLQSTMPHHMRFAEAIYDIHDFALGKLHANDIALDVDKDGELLQFLGTGWGRKKYGEDVWVELLKRGINKKALQFANHYSNHLFIVSDCRFKNEFLAFPDALSIRLHCDQELRKARAHAWREDVDHISETDLDSMNHKFSMSFYTDTNSVMQIADMLMTEIRKRLGMTR